MNENVVKLELVEVGEGFRFEADQILEGAKASRSARLPFSGSLKTAQFGSQATQTPEKRSFSWRERNGSSCLARASRGLQAGSLA